MRGVRIALGLAGFCFVVAGTYFGVRVGADAFGEDEPPPAVSRPGIEGIVAGPIPEAPVRPPSSSQASDQGAPSNAGDDYAADTVSPGLTGTDVQGTSTGTDTADGGGSEGGGNSSSPPPPDPEPEPVEKEEPPKIRYPG